MNIACLSAALIAIAASNGVVAQTPLPPAAFEVATIKPIDPNGGGRVGFYSYPGGRVVVGAATVKMLMYYAFDVQEFQIQGGPDWAGSARYDVAAVPPENSESRTAKQPPVKATPSDEQRAMLKTLLVERFGLKFHSEMKERPAYILTRGKKPLQLQTPKDKDADSRVAVMMKAGGIVDGEAFGTNISMASLVKQLSRYMNSPVLDETGLEGTYDFHIQPFDPENHDMTIGTMEAMEHLGLRLKLGKGQMETLVIDEVTRPTQN